MTWEIKVLDEFEREIVDKIVEEVVDNLEERNIDRHDENAVDDAISEIVDECVDGWFVYNVDQLAALQHYGHIADGMDACWDDIIGDVSNKAKDRFWE